MPVFISYSHADKKFVDRFAADIVKRQVSVWLDRWELNVGDSIIEKVQEAILTSSALLVVLSRASVESTWCKKELNAGLIRELEEKQVVVLPVLLEDCPIPLFLRDKMYADFRTDYERGLQQVLDAIARVSNATQSRLEDQDWTLDWAMDWWYEEDLFRLRFTIVEQPHDLPMTLLTEILILFNDAASRRFKKFADAGLDWMARMTVAAHVSSVAAGQAWYVNLEDQMPKTFEVAIADSGSLIRHDVVVTSRRLGLDNGKIQMVRIANYLRYIEGYAASVTRPMTGAEQKSYLEIASSPAT